MDGIEKIKKLIIPFEMLYLANSWNVMNDLIVMIQYDSNSIVSIIQSNGLILS